MNSNLKATCPQLITLLNNLETEEQLFMVEKALNDHWRNCRLCPPAEDMLQRLLTLYRKNDELTLSPEFEERLLSNLCGQYIEESKENITMSTTRGTYSFSTTLSLPIEEALAKITVALKHEGFGILTNIDIKETMKKKLNVDFEPYLILGVCNPQLAHQALEAVHDIGLLLPCNVILHTHGDQTSVYIADPLAMLAIIQEETLQKVAKEASERLQRVITKLNVTAI